MRMIVLAFLAVFYFCECAVAWVHGNYFPSITTINLGHAFNGGAGIDYPYINYVKSWSPTIPDPGILDTSGYPASSPGATIAGQIPFISSTQTGVGTKWVLRWTGQCGTSSNCFQMSIPTNVTSDPGGCVQGSTTINTVLKGTNCRIEFNFTNNPTGLTLQILAGTQLNGTLVDLALYRFSDETAYNANMAGSVPFGGFNPDYIHVLQALHPKAVRFLNFNCVNFGVNGNMAADVSMQTPVHSIAYTSTVNWFQAIWAGSTSTGSGTNAAYRATAPGGVTTLTDGLSMQLRFTSAGTGSMTLSIDGGITNVPIVGQTGSGGVTSIAAASNWTVVYDALLNVFLSSNSSAITCMPIPVMVALSNAISADMWFNIPPYATLAYVSSAAATIKASLVGTANYELANEIWNFLYSSTTWFRNRGIALGFSVNNNEREFGAFGLRIRQVMAAVKTAYGAQSNYRRVAVSQATNSSHANLYIYQGGDLNPASNSALCLWLGGTFSGSCSGAPNYSAFPNRPIDYSDALGYAVYWEGAQANGTDPAYVSTFGQSSNSISAANNGNPVTITTNGHGYSNGQHVKVAGLTGNWLAANGGWVVSSVATNTFTIPVDATTFGALTGTGTVTRFANELNALLAAADSFASGGGGIATGVTALDNDLRAGTNYGVIGGGTLSAFNTGVYPAWETIAASYDGVNRPSGMSNLVIMEYEGAMQSIAPAASTCTTLGIDPKYCGDTGTIANLLGWTYPPATGAYRSSAEFQATSKLQFDQFMAGGGTIGAASHSISPAWLILSTVTGATCGGTWAIESCDIYTGTPYTSFEMIRSYHYP